MSARLQQAILLGADLGTARKRLFAAQRSTDGNITKRKEKECFAGSFRNSLREVENIR